VVESSLEHCLFSIFRRISAATPRPSAPASAREQLFAEGKFTEILAQVDACLPKDGEGNFIAYQEKSDVVHDLLAFLAERMLEMNKQKQQEIKGFLGWLEGYLGAKVEDLTPKTVARRATTSTITMAFWRCSRRTARSWTIDPARRSPLKRFGPSSRDRWANWGRCGSGSGRRTS
jgi:hypothetical protein